MATIQDDWHQDSWSNKALKAPLHMKWVFSYSAQNNLMMYNKHWGVMTFLYLAPKMQKNPGYFRLKYLCLVPIKLLEKLKLNE